MKPLHERVRTLREARGLSQPDLFRRVDGVGLDTVRGVEAPPDNRRHRYPSARVLAALAKALDVSPGAFPEYRLAQARRLFNEREIGLDEAVENLAILDEVIAAVRERLPEDDRVAHLLEELAETRPPAEGEDAQAGPPGSE